MAPLTPELARQLAIRAWLERQAAATGTTYARVRVEWLAIARLLGAGWRATPAAPARPDSESAAILALRARGYLDTHLESCPITVAGHAFLGKHPAVVAAVQEDLDRLAGRAPWQDPDRWLRWYLVALTWFEAEQAAKRPVDGAGLFTPQTVPAAEVDHYRAIAACLERLRAPAPLVQGGVR